MLYPFLQFLMRLSLSAHYNQIFTEGKKLVPKNQPLLLAATHPNSFLDAIILGSVIDRPLHFLARSDVFNTRIADYLLRKLNLIPIYRLQEGHQNLNRNDETFKACYDLLEKGHAVLIFAEGISLTDRLVRKPKKGLARIGFGAEERNDFKLNLVVQPVALNYEEATGFENRILVNFAEAFSLNEFKELYQEHPNKAYEAVNTLLYSALQDNSILLDEEDDTLFEYLSHQVPDSYFSLAQLQLLATKLKNLKSNNSEQFLLLKKSSSTLEEAFGKTALQLNGFKNREKTHLLRVILDFIPGSIGYLANRLPFLLAHLIAKKTVVLPEFFASVKLVLATVFWLLYSIGLGIYLGNSFSAYFYLMPLYLFAIGKSYQRFSKSYEAYKSQLYIKKLEKLNENESLTQAKNVVDKFMQDLALNV